MTVSPVEDDQLALQLVQQLAGDLLHRRFVAEDKRVTLGEDVEHHKLFLGELLTNVALLLLIEVVGQASQLVEELLDVLRARVVALDQVAEPVGVIDSLWVQSKHPLQTLFQRRLQPGRGRGPVSLANNGASASKSICVRSTWTTFQPGVTSANVELSGLDSFVVAPHQFDSMSDVFAGGSRSGNHALTVPTAEVASLVLYTSAGFSGDDVHFSAH